MQTSARNQFNQSARHKPFKTTEIILFEQLALKRLKRIRWRGHFQSLWQSLQPWLKAGQRQNDYFEREIQDNPFWWESL